MYQHPDQNLFDVYENDPEVIILTGEDWIRKIGFTNKEKEDTNEI